jgi:hypothetical protein
VHPVKSFVIRKAASGPLIAILLSSSTTAIAILEAALKKMHVAFTCAL